MSPSSFVCCVCLHYANAHLYSKQTKCRPLRCSETVRRRRKKTSFLSRATLFSRSRFGRARDARASRRRLFSLRQRAFVVLRGFWMSFSAHTRKEVFRRNRGIEKRATTRRGNRARDDARVWVGWCRVTSRTIFRRGVSRVRVARARWISHFSSRPTGLWGR